MHKQYSDACDTHLCLNKSVHLSLESLPTFLRNLNELLFINSSTMQGFFFVDWYDIKLYDKKK